MSQSSNIARPYAQAVFELARDSNRYDEWSDSLETLTQIMSNSDLDALIHSPRINRDQIIDIVLEIGGDALDEHTQNLVRILGHYRRLPMVPQIAEQFEFLRAEEEGIIEAELETAYEIDEAQQKVLTEALQSRLGRKVRLLYRVNKDLIGGVVIRAGDWVIDGSLRAQLAKLSSSLGI